MKKIDENTSYEELLKQKQICMVELGALCVATSVLTTILRNPAPFIPFLGITHELTSKMKKIESIAKEILLYMIDLERYGWPPSCTGIVYQPERPYAIKQQTDKRVQIKKAS